jgi:[citrate (pro-3S)-lyase] ligase
MADKVFTLNTTTLRRLSDMTSLGTIGGHVLDYLVDTDVKKIAIYGIDEYAVFVYMQAVNLGFEIEAMLSDHDFDVWCPLTKEVVFFSDYNKHSKLSSPIVIACNGKYYPFGKVNLNGNAGCFLDDYLRAYSRDKHTIVKYAKDHERQGVTYMLVRLPSIWDIRKKSTYEKNLRSMTAEQKAEVQQRELLEPCGISQNKMQAIVEECDPRFYTHFGMPTCEDFSGEYVHYNSGFRLVTDLPSEYDHVIWLYGNSVNNGWRTEDSATVASCLQREINNRAELSYAVKNPVCGGGACYEKIVQRMPYDNIHPGDIVCIMLHHISPYTLKRLKDSNILCLNAIPLFERPHDMGEVFGDSQHYTPKGHATIAKGIVEQLANHNIDERNNNHLIEHRGITTEYPVELNNYILGIRTLDIPKIGAIVMNCNPFTNGHRYLIEHCSRKVAHLVIFIVEEDKSVFPFTDRIRLVQQGTIDLKNVTVCPSGSFIISSMTFPEYSKKGELQERTIDPSYDVRLFASEIAPALGITVRFAGDEPLDNITRQYNDTMAQILPDYGIDFEVVSRLESDGEVISASRVRKLLETLNFDEIAKIVPQTTLEYLVNKFAVDSI